MIIIYDVAYLLSPKLKSYVTLGLYRMLGITRVLTNPIVLIIVRISFNLILSP